MDTHGTNNPNHETTQFHESLLLLTINNGEGWKEQGQGWKVNLAEFAELGERRCDCLWGQAPCLETKTWDVSGVVSCGNPARVAGRTRGSASEKGWCQEGLRPIDAGRNGATSDANTEAIPRPTKWVSMVAA